MFISSWTQVILWHGLPSKKIVNKTHLLMQFMLSPLQQLHSSAPQEASSSTRLWTYKTTYLYSGSLFALTLLFIQRSGSGSDEMKPSIPCKFKARKSLIYLLLDCKLYKALPMNALLSLYSGPNRLSNFVQNFSLFGAEAYYAIWTRYVSLRSFNTTQEFRPLFHSTKGCAGCHPQVLCLGLGPDFVQ
jgi:hypothetical protein